MTDTVVVIRGGVLVEAYSRRPGERITVIDWDDANAGELRSAVGEIRCTHPREMHPQTKALLQEAGNVTTP